MYPITAFFLPGVMLIASATTIAVHCAKKLCGHSGSWSSSCPSDRQLVNINDSLKNVLVNAHNEKRKIIAGGGVSKLKPTYFVCFFGSAIGHFTVMVADRNIEVGCAASTYSVRGQSYKAFLLACNYATTNILGVRMYASCSQGASGCTTGTNPSYKNLCSTRESYSPNNI